MMARWGGLAFGFALAAAYWPGISGAATSPRWALAAFVLPLWLMFAGRLKVTVAHLIGALFVAWALATYAWSASPLDTLGAGWKLIVLAAAFCLGGQFETMRPVYVGAAVGLGASALIAALALSGVAVLPDHPQASAGLFVNPLFFGEACALVFAALLLERSWWLLAVIPGLMLTAERGSILAAGVALLLALWPRGRVMVGAVVLVISMAVGVITLSPNRIQTATDRIAAWSAVAPVTTQIGTGLGSYWEAAPQPIAGTRLEHPHNEFIEATFEAGWIGAGLLAAFFAVVLFAGPLDAEALVLIALLTEAMVAFPFHEPFTAALGLLCAGHRARHLHGLRDATVDGRAALRRRLARRPRTVPLAGAAQ